MTKTRKKQLTLCTLIVALAMLLSGLICVYSLQNKIKASAEMEGTSNTSGNLYFDGGASARIAATDLYELRYTLNVTRSAYASSSELTIGFVSEYGANSYLTLSDDGINATEQSLTVVISSLTSDKLNVIVKTRLFEDVRLEARIGSDVAQSATRNSNYVFTKYVESGDIDDDPNTNAYSKQYIKDLVAFTGERETFDIFTRPQLSSESGLSFVVKVPDDSLELLNRNIETAYSSSLIPNVPNGYIKTQYILEIGIYTENLYGSTDIPLGNHVYSKNDSNYESFPGNFLQTGEEVFSFDVPYDADREYYVFAMIREEKEYGEYWHPSGYYKLETTYSINRFTSNYYHGTIQDIALELLENDVGLRSDAERAWLQDVGGVKPDTLYILVTLNYKECVGYTDIREKSKSFYVKSVWAQNKTLVVSALYKTSIKNKSNLNVVYTGDYYEDGRRYITQTRIILQAEDYDYSYNAETEKGTLNVVYTEFKYKDLSFRITNNDPENNLTIDYYTANVDVGATYTTLTFAFEDIEEQLYNSCNWLFKLNKDHIQVTGAGSGVVTQVTDSALTVQFRNDAENELVNLSLIGAAEIIEDIEYELTYEYVQLTETNTGISERIKQSAPIAKMYSEIVTYNFTNFMLDYGEIVNGAVNPEFLSGATYYIADSIRKDYSSYESETHTCNIIVEYRYNTLFRITNTCDDEVVYKSLNHVSLFYSGADFVPMIPDGYRVESLTTPAAYADKLTIVNAEDYRNSSIEVRIDTNANEILPIVVHYTDRWNISVTYLENYIDYGMKKGEQNARSSFAEKKVYSGTIRVSDYDDIYALTANDMRAILGVDTLDILNLATVESVSMTYDGISTYTSELKYSYAALKQIDYDGNTKEIKVPLTSYADWCDTYGKDWSILYLNTTNRHYFKYSNDIARENLYGFFSVAVFEERVSDLNFYFQNNTGDGCMTIFSGSEVKGSALYSFFARLTSKSGFMGTLLGVPLISTMCMNLCELFDDNNAIYYSYFFYLDGSSDNAYLALNGADNADDTSSAIKNRLEDVGDWIKDKLSELNIPDVLRVLKIIAGVVLVILVVTLLVSGVYKLLVWSSVIRRKDSGKKKSGSNRKK